MSTIGNTVSILVSILDSLYKDVDEATNAMLGRVLKMPSLKFTFPCTQTQTGSKDCGLFVIAFGVHKLPHFDQSKLRPQLINYLQQKEMNVFN